MKTINEAAIEYAKLGGNLIDFRAGAQFAEEWINLSEELPEIKEKPYQIFLMKFREESPYYDVGIVSNKLEFNLNFYTHWRPINKK